MSVTNDLTLTNPLTERDGKQGDRTCPPGMDGGGDVVVGGPGEGGPQPAVESVLAAGVQTGQQQGPRVTLWSHGGCGPLRGALHQG
jgi:hypothetical protein